MCYRLKIHCLQACPCIFQPGNVHAGAVKALSYALIEQICLCDPITQLFLHCHRAKQIFKALIMSHATEQEWSETLFSFGVGRWWAAQEDGDGRERDWAVAAGNPGAAVPATWLRPGGHVLQLRLQLREWGRGRHERDAVHPHPGKSAAGSESVVLSCCLLACHVVLACCLVLSVVMLSIVMLSVTWTRCCPLSSRKTCSWRWVCCHVGCCHVVCCLVGYCHVVCDMNEMLSTLIQKYCSWGWACCHVVRCFVRCHIAVLSCCLWHEWDAVPSHPRKSAVGGESIVLSCCPLSCHALLSSHWLVMVCCLVMGCCFVMVCCFDTLLSWYGVLSWSIVLSLFVVRLWSAAFHGLLFCHGLLSNCHVVCCSVTVCCFVMLCYHGLLFCRGLLSCPFICCLTVVYCLVLVCLVLLSCHRLLCGSLLEDVPLVEFVYLVFTEERCNQRRDVIVSNASPFSSKVVVCGHCLMTLSLRIMKHWNGSHLNAGVILVVTV